MKKDIYWIDVRRGLILKLVSLLLTVYNVRLMVSYLGNNIYGGWITVSSIISWMSVGDLGIGNGLRNDISRHYVQNDNVGIIGVIFSTHRFYLCASVTMFFLILGIGRFFCLYEIIAVEYFGPLIISALFSVIVFFVGRVRMIAQGIQKSWYVGLANVIGEIISIICYKSMGWFRVKPNLYICSFVYGFVTIIPLFIIVEIIKYKDLSDIGTREYNYNKEFVREIIKNSVQFCILQLTSLVLFATDSVMVDYLFGSSEVTRYSLINQIYTVGASLYGVILNSFWSGVAIHYTKKDFGWIVTNIKKLLLVLLMFSIGVVFVSGLINPIIRVWVNDETIYYTPGIIIVFGVYCILDSLQAIYGNFNYAINNTKMIMWLGVFSAVVNIPISLFFVRWLDMGIMGIKLGSLISLLPSWCCIIVYTIIYLKKLKRKPSNMNTTKTEMDMLASE